MLILIREAAIFKKNRVSNRHLPVPICDSTGYFLIIQFFRQSLGELPIVDDEIRKASGEEVLEDESVTAATGTKSRAGLTPQDSTAAIYRRGHQAGANDARNGLSPYPDRHENLYTTRTAKIFREGYADGYHRRRSVY